MWVFDHETDADAIMNELRTQTDRGLAIIAASLLESALERRIKCELPRRTQKVEDRLFKGTAPLGSFSAKIDLAHLMGLMDLEDRKLFIWIKEIRNEFAHSSEARSFETQRIKDLCNNLVPATQVFNYFAEIEGGHPLVDAMKKSFRASLRRALKKGDSPRARFEANAQASILVTSFGVGKIRFMCDGRPLLLGK